MLFPDLATGSLTMDSLVRRFEDPQANIPAMPPPPGVIPNFVHHPSKAHVLIVVYSVFLGVSVTFVALRMYTRLFITRSVGYDDYTSVMALIMAIIFTALNLRLIHYGMGVHMWDIPLSVYSPHFLYWAHIATLMYVSLMIFAKSSILLLYHRIFKPSRLTAWAIYAILALLVSYNIAIMISVIFACTPREKSWYILTPGTCIDILGLGVAGAALNLISDVIILVLPMPIIWKLRLPLKQKLAVVGIFATGAFVCAVAIVRLQAISGGRFDPDVTWSQIPNSVWSSIECNVGIACGCMPCLKHFFTRYTPKLMSLTSLNSKGNSSKRNKHGSSSGGGGAVEISGRRNKAHPSMSSTANGEIDPRFASGKYLELGEMGTHETVIGGASSKALYSHGSMDPMVTPAPPEAAMVADGRGIVKTVGVDVSADEKGR